jgi:transposase
MTEMGKGMEKERHKVQILTAEQLEVLRTRLAQKGNEPPPQPEKFMMGEIVRAVYPELKRLRENGYSLKVLVRVLEEKGVVITANALSTYMKKLALTREEAQPRTARKGSSVTSLTAGGRPGQFQMKPDVPL